MLALGDALGAMRGRTAGLALAVFEEFRLRLEHRLEGRLRRRGRDRLARGSGDGGSRRGGGGGHTFGLGGRGVDLGQHPADGDGRALLGGKRGHDAGGRGGHFDVDLVGRHVDERRTGVDPLAGLDAPLHDRTLGDGLAHFGEGHFDERFRHATAVRSAQRIPF